MINMNSATRSTHFLGTRVIPRRRTRGRLVRRAKRVPGRRTPDHIVRKLTTPNISPEGLAYIERNKTK